MTTLEAAWSRTAVLDGPIRLPIWPLGLFTLWDFYFAGIRPFDHLGAAIVIGAVVLRSDRRFDGDRLLKFGALIAFIWLMVLFGALQHADAWKPAIGLLEGGLVALLVVSANWRDGEVVRFLKVMILCHGIAVLLQFGVHMLFNYSLNYQAWLGASLRTDTGLGMRPAGLFLEPAGFGMMMFSLLALFRLSGGVSWRIELFGLSMLMLSVSLWAWGATVVYLVMFRPWWALIAMPVAAAVLLYALTLVGTDFDSNLVASVILRRIAQPGHDASAKTRYGGLLSASDFWSWGFWFGQGVTNDYEQYGANGLSFLLSCTGVVGTIVVIVLWLAILPWGRKLRGTASLVFLLSSASQWTFIWWWVWLALAAGAPFGIGRALSASSRWLDERMRGLENARPI